MGGFTNDVFHFHNFTKKGRVSRFNERVLGNPISTNHEYVKPNHAFKNIAGVAC